MYTVYALKEGYQMVYIGQTNDIERRLEEHRNEGKKFDSREIIGRFPTESEARKEEERKLQEYRSRNGGRNPKYNETDHG